MREYQLQLVTKAQGLLWELEEPIIGKATQIHSVIPMFLIIRMNFISYASDHSTK